jgi:hypothetical protein
MRITLPHNTTKDEAKRIVESRLAALEQQYGHFASDIDKTWDGDRMDFKVKAKGFSGNGTLEVTDTELIIDGKLPLMAKPFEPRIKSTVEREVAEMFRRA